MMKKYQIISQSEESAIYFFLPLVISVLRKYFHHEIPGKVPLNFLYLATMIKWWVRLNVDSNSKRGQFLITIEWGSPILFKVE